MPANLKPLSPPITLADGQKNVCVGALTWGDFKAVLDEFRAAKLPLPKLSVDSMSASFTRIQDLYKLAAASEPQAAFVATQQASSVLYEMLGTLVAENLPTLEAWFLAHPPIVSMLVHKSSNLQPAEVDQLSAGQLLRVASAAWSALSDDGFFSEAAGFFGGLLGLKLVPAANAASQPATSGTDSENQSTSASAA